MKRSITRVTLTSAGACASLALTCAVAMLCIVAAVATPSTASAAADQFDRPFQATTTPRNPAASTQVPRPTATIGVREIRIVQPTAAPTLVPTAIPEDVRPFGVDESTMRLYRALEWIRSGLSNAASGFGEAMSSLGTTLGTIWDAISGYGNFLPPPSLPALPTALPRPVAAAPAAPAEVADQPTITAPTPAAKTTPTIGASSKQVDSVIELGTIESILSPYSNIIAIIGGLLALLVFASIARSLTGLLREQRVRNDQNIAIALQSARGELHGKRVDEMFPAISQLIADTAREVIVLQDGVGVVSRAIEPAPQFTVVGADGHEFVFTTDPAWIRKKYGARAVKKVTSLRGVSVTARARAQAIWERVVSERSSAVGPSSNDWFMVKCAPRA